jgi:hypothetical protein
MHLPGVTRFSEPLHLDFAAHNPKRARRIFIRILCRKAQRYNLGTILEQRVDPSWELPLECGIFSLKGRKTIAHLGFVDVCTPINEIGRRKLDVGKKSKRQPKALSQPSRFRVGRPSFCISFPIVVVDVDQAPSGVTLRKRQDEFDESAIVEVETLEFAGDAHVIDADIYWPAMKRKV